MSHVALATAVRDRLRVVLGAAVPAVTSESVEIQPDGQPDPMCGEWYASVCQGDWRGDSGDWDLGERVGVEVTVTRRLGYAPADRWGPVTWAEAGKGFYAVLRLIVANVHLSETVRIAANAELGLTSGGAGGFVEALRFQSGGRPERKGPDWFGAEEAVDGRRRVANAGLAQTLAFGDAYRLQGSRQEAFT